MITDIFLERYEHHEAVGSLDWSVCKAPLTQAAQILFDEAYPEIVELSDVGLFTVDDIESVCREVHNRVIRELAVERIRAGRNYTDICRNVLTKGSDIFDDIPQFHLLAFSFLELLFAAFEQQVNGGLQELVALRDKIGARGGMNVTATNFGAFEIGTRTPSKLEEIDHRIPSLQKTLSSAIDELNYRLGKAGLELRYHNTKLQLADEGPAAAEIEEPFWRLFADRKWNSAVKDFQEAIDRRDNNGRDPTAVALQGLESIVKIICNEKGRATGKERGFADWVNSLVREVNGSRFIEVWEKDMLIALNSEARNPHNHGPGAAPHPIKTPQQVSFCISCAMAWAQSLATRP